MLLLIRFQSFDDLLGQVGDFGFFIALCIREKDVMGQVIAEQDTHDELPNHGIWPIDDFVFFFISRQGLRKCLLSSPWGSW